MTVTQPDDSNHDYTRRDPVGRRPNIWAVKSGVRIEQAAQSYGEFRMVGDGRLLGRCISPHHEDKTPSMSVYAGEGRFRCFGCGEHGDVIDLVVLAEGCETWEALVLLSTRYGIELPGRPSSWHRKQRRQRPVRDAIERSRIEHVRLLVYRLIWMPWLKTLPEWVREEAEESAWKDALWTAERLYASRMGSGREER